MMTNEEPKELAAQRPASGDGEHKAINTSNTNFEPLPARASSAARVLRLTLKKRWFEMIASGEKREEYRTPRKWILSRLEGKEYDRIEFKNGYGPNVPTMEVEYRGWKFSFGKREWGGGSTTGPFATIMLGRVLSRQNVEVARESGEKKS